MPLTKPLPVQEVARPTCVIEAPRLSAYLGAKVTLVSETFQYTGSFKFRCAYNVAAGVPNEQIITASSGNFGQALAYACRLLGKRCTIVMPDKSARVKVEAVKEFGGIVELVDTSCKSRAQRVEELIEGNPDAYVASAYDDPLVIEGNATLGAEIAAMKAHFDCVVVPVGGGGLSSGIISGIKASGRTMTVVGAEPALANDAARSLRAGHLVRDTEESSTIADGARTLSLGRLNWEILRDGIADIIEVPEDKIAGAVRLLFGRANLKAEPTGALAVAAVLSRPDQFTGKSVCCVVSGGNVDPQIFSELLHEPRSGA